MNKLESFVENFPTTSLESSESACICPSTIGMHRMHTSIDDQAQIASQRFPTVSNVFKDGAYYCYCAYVLRISRYSDYLSPLLTNTGIFLRGLKLSGESRS